MINGVSVPDGQLKEGIRRKAERGRGRFALYCWRRKNEMSVAAHPHVDTERAKLVWAEYQRAHDLTAQKGKVAAIEPVSGRGWVGASGIEVADRMALDGVNAPVFLIRIGYDHFVRKGRR